MRKMLLFVLSVCVFAGCSQEAQNKKEFSGEKIRITHDSGETDVKHKPSRVVILDFSALDTMQSLGLSDKVVALPKLNLPEYLNEFADKKYADIGGLKEFDYELINMLSPDLIIISVRQLAAYDELSKIAPTINLNVDGARYLDSFKENARIIGKLWGKTHEVDSMLADIDLRMRHLVEYNTENDKTGLIIMHNAGKFSAYGSGSRFGIIHDVFGVKPVQKEIEASTHGKSISSEFISRMNPDYLFIIDRNVVITKKATPKNEIENKLIKMTNAYKNGKIIYLTPDYWYISNAGVKSMGYMIQEVESGLVIE